MIHNLTDRQLQGLRWIVGKIKDGELRESFGVVDLSSKDGVLLRFGRLDAPQYVDHGTLDALINSNVLTQHTSVKRYTITKIAYEIAAFDFDNPEPEPKRSYLKETLRLIPTSFEPEEFIELCFDLDINPRWELGDEKGWPLELLLYLYRRNRLSDLPPVLKEHRPKIDWPAYHGQETVVI